FLKIILALIFLNLNYLSANAQEQSTSRKQLFDYDWSFSLSNDSLAKRNDFNDKSWRKLDLPHDWSIEGKIDPKNPMGNDGGYFPAGIGWYRKTFNLPANLSGKQTSIYFEGVYMNAEVFINGKSLGIYPYGYTSFTYDLTPYLKYGAANVIAVKVDNSKQKNSRWYSGSGIYRHVWLINKPNVNVANWGVGITTENVSAKQADVRIVTTLKNETNKAKRVVLKTVLNATSNKSVGNANTTLVLDANAEKSVTQIIKVANPSLWEPNHPRLYKANVKVLDDKSVDEVNTTFGIRSIKFTATKGFELNGKTVKINGGNVHHDNGSLGAAAFDRAENRKAELLKTAGFNAVRTSHNPPSEAFLNACDSIGLLVIDESFDGWRSEKNKFDYAIYFDKWAKKDVQAMVK
ncbi:MAG: beta-galactosidase, partial [Pedobacter sp.]